MAKIGTIDFNNNQVSNIANEFANFASLKSTESAQDFSALSVLGALAKGYVQGFTTFAIGEPVQNPVEAVAHSIGSLAGFIGWAPGASSLGGALTKGLGKTVSMAFKGEKALALTQATAKAGLFLPSIPMGAANLIFKGAEGLGVKTAIQSAEKYLLSQGISKEAINIGGHAIHQGAHMGTAMAVSSWQDGVDAMFSSFTYGFTFASGSAILGQYLPTAGRAIEAPRHVQLLQDIQDPRGIARIMSSAMFSAIPSYVSDAPFELQVYELLLGAYFGAIEMPLSERRALGFLRYAPMKAHGGVEMHKASQDISLHGFSDPTTKIGARYAALKRVDPQAAEIVAQQIELKGLKWIGDAESGVSLAGIEVAQSIENVLKTKEGAIPEETMRSMLSTELYNSAVKLAQERTGLEANVEDPEWNVALHRASMDVLKQSAKDIDDYSRTVEYRIKDIKEHVKFMDQFKTNTDTREIAVLEEELSQDKDYPRSLIPTSKKLARTIFNTEKKKGTEIKVEDFLKTQIKVKDVFKKHIADKDNPKAFDNLIKDIQSELGLELVEGKGSLWRDVRKSWNWSTRLEPMLQKSLHRSGGELITQIQNELDMYGHNVTKFVERPFLWEKLGRGVFNIKNSRTVKVTENEATSEKLFETEEVKPFDDPDFNIVELMLTLDQNNETLLFASKDSGVLIGMPYLDNAKDPVAVKEYIEAIREEIPTFDAEVKLLQEDFMNEFKALKGKKFTEKQAHAAFWKSLMNTMMAREKLEGVDIITIMQNPDKFMLSKNTPAAEWNKRTSLLNNGFLRLDPTYMSRVEGAENGLNTVIINALNKNGMDMVEGSPDLTDWVLDKSGEYINRKTETHVDGVIYLRDDVFDMLVLQGGLEGGTGAQKGTLLHSEPKQGLLIGKFAYHKAGAKISESMKSKNIHTIINSTAAKQTGLRIKHDAQWSNNKLKFYNEGKRKTVTPTIYTIPHDSFTYTEGGEHLDRALVPQKLASQFMSGIDSQRFPETTKWLNEISNTNFRGSATHEDLFSKWAQGDTRVDPNKIDVEQLGIQTLLDIFTSGKKDIMWKRVFETYIKDYDDIIDGDTPWDDPEAFLLKETTQKRAAADRILDLAEASPALLASPMVQKYVETIFKSALTKRISRPKLTGSASSIMNPYRWDLISKLKERGGLQEGEMLLGDAYKDYTNFPWRGRSPETNEVRLEDAYNEYLALKENPNKNKESEKLLKQMEEDITFLVERVPTDSPSGVRPIKFIGFSDIAGSGVVLHPEDMINLGGADLDIDKAYLYNGMPGSVKKEFEKTKYEWYDFFDPSTKKKITEEEYRSNPKKFIKILRDSKPTDSPFLAESKATWKNTKLSAFSPLHLNQIGRMAYEGNRLLGPAISMAKKLNGLLEAQTKELSVSDVNAFRELKRQMINYGADAANGTELVSHERALEILTSSLFKKKQIKEKQKSGEQPVLRDETDAELLKRVKGNKLYKQISKLEAFNRGKDFEGKLYNFGDFVSIAQEANRYLDKESLKFNSAYYRNFLRMSEINLSRIGEVPFMDASAPEKLNEISSQIRLSETFLRLIGRSAEGIRFYNNFRNAKGSPYASAHSKYDKMIIANELTAQSGLDAANAVNILFQAPKDKLGKLDLDLKVTDDLLRRADELKKEFSTLLITKDKAKRSGEDVNTSALKLQIDKKIEQITNGLPQAYRKLFHAYMLSSLSYQKDSLPDFVKKYTDAINKKYDQQAAIFQSRIDKRNAEGKATNKLKVKLDQVDVARQAELKTATAEAKREWWSTNQNTWVYELNSIDPSVVRDQLFIYEDIIQKTNTHIPDDYITQLDHYLDTPAITTGVEQPSVEKANLRFLNFVQDYAERGKTVDKSKVDPKILAQLKTAGETIAKYYKKHPEKIKDVEAMFAKESQLQKALLGFEGGNTLRLATPEQVIEFARILQLKLNNAGKNFKPEWYHYFWRPETIGEKMRTYEDSGETPEEIPIQVSRGVTGFGEVKQSMSTFQKINSIWNWGEKAYEGAFRSTEYKYKTHPLLIGLRDLDKNKDEIGKELWDLAVRYRERDLAKVKGAKGHRTETYQEYWKRVEPRFKELMGSSETVLIPGISSKPIAIREVFDKIVEFQNTTMKEILQTKMVNKIAEEAFFAKVTDENGNVDTDKAFEILAGELSANKFIFRGVNFINKLMHHEMLNKIKIRGDTFMKYLYKKTSGFDVEGGSVSEFLSDSGFKDFWNNLFKGTTPDNFSRSDNEVLDIFLKKYNDFVESGEDFSLVLEEIQNPATRSRLLSQLKASRFNESGWMDYKDFGVQDWFHKYYYPHNTFLEKATKKYLLDKISKMVMGKDEIGGTENDIALVRRQVEGQTENPEDRANSVIRHLEDIMDSKGIEAKHIENFTQHLSSSLARDTDDPLPGWSTDRDVLIKYENQMDRFYYSYLASGISRHQIKKLNQTKALGDFTESWGRFFSLYNRDQLGHASKFPDAWLNDPNLQIRHNPYYALTDDYWIRRADKVGKKFFNGKKFYKDIKEAGLEDKFTPELKTRIQNDPKVKELLDTIYANSVDKRLTWWSQLEGKFELLTLLSHPKTMINNFFSGDMNTLSQTGMRHWKKTFDQNYMINNLFPGAKNKADIDAIIEKNGGVEAMFFSEFGLNKLFNTGVYNKVFKQVMAVIKKEGYNEKKITDVLKENGLGEAFLNTAGYFMRTSEVQLRRRSWLAHYNQAREVLSVNGMHLEPEHPWLVQWANKGVGATQFLYNNANRPAFVRTNLGKMFGRFQLWAWNSLYFRREVHKMAYASGYKPGTAEFSRLRNLMTADLLVLALGAALPYSMFDSTVAPPLGYVQDLSAWMFGDQEERDKAFFGALPWPANIVGIATPPISRFAFAPISLLLNGNLDATARVLMTAIPFGRLGTSTYRTFESPIMAIDNFTGLPFVKTASFFKKQYKNKVPYNINPLLSSLSKTE